MQNIDFRQKNHFLLQKKILKFDPSKPFMDKLVKLSRKLKKRHIYMNFGFRLQSHSATFKKIFFVYEIIRRVCP